MDKAISNLNWPTSILKRTEQGLLYPQAGTVSMSLLCDSLTSITAPSFIDQEVQLLEFEDQLLVDGVSYDAVFWAAGLKPPPITGAVVDKCQRWQGAIFYMRKVSSQGSRPIAPMDTF